MAGAPLLRLSRRLLRTHARRPHSFAASGGLQARPLRDRRASAEICTVGAAFRPARNASEGEGGLYVDHTATMRSNTLSSASRGSEHTPLCTGDIWMTVLRGATSQ